MSHEYWNAAYARGIRDAFRDDVVERAETAALDFFGNVMGASVADIGCGSGESALCFASHGANVTAIDASETAIAQLLATCATRRITNVRPVCCSAFDIARLGRFDFVFGTMILHHLEPFSEFARVLAEALAPGGRAFFSENSAANPLLMWARTHLAGRRWIPKNSDDKEFPLTPGEVDELRKHLRVEVLWPRLVMFEMLDSYVLRKRFPPLRTALIGLDNLCYRVPALRRLSYLQTLLVEKT